MRNKKINWWKIDFDNKDFSSLKNSFLNRNISQGPKVLKLEQELAKFLKVKYVVMMPSCSLALLSALMSLNISKNDEIIMPNRTWIATAHAAILLGAKVKLVDVQENIPIRNETLKPYNFLQKAETLAVNNIS